MNNIKWNEVTWYSKLGAVIVFLVVVPILTFCIGRSYEQYLEVRSLDVSLNTDIVTNQSPVISSDTVTHLNEELGFTVDYPRDWKPNTGTPPEDAIASFNLTIPSEYSINNRPDSSTISKLEAGIAVFMGPCRSVKLPIALEDSPIINGITFDHIISNDAATSHQYYSELYTTYRNNSCYQVYLSEVISSPGAYTDKQAEVSKMEEINRRVTARALKQFEEFVHSFKFVDTPAGIHESEAPRFPLTNITPSTVSIQTAKPESVTLTGEQFSGHDTLVWIRSNTSIDHVGVLWGGMPLSDTSINVPVPTRVCSRYVGASGLPCPWYMTLKPGTYQVYVQNQNGRSNTLPLTIK